MQQGYVGGFEQWEGSRSNQGYGRWMDEDEYGRGSRQGYGSQGRSGQGFGRGMDEWEGGRFGSQDYGGQGYARGMTEWGGGRFSRSPNRSWRGNQGPFSGVGPQGYQRADERIREDINEQLTWDGDLDATNIEVRVANGIVTLTGMVSDRWAKRSAEDIADSIRGVQDVQNQIQVRRQDEMVEWSNPRSTTQSRSQGAQSSQGTQNASSASGRKNAQSTTG
jgi:hypothetical protein